ncbi:MAG: hypothetical protein NDJ89_01015 [Oligoflexia bacterium]|nr:hypothetical protein [Oligoflexia bacterium]
MSETYVYSGQKAKFPALTRQELGASEGGFELRPGGWVIYHSPDGSRRRLMAFEQRGQLSVSLDGRLFHGRVHAESRHSGGAAAGGGDSDLVAQFPGKVRKVLVAEGTKVAEGEPMVLVEAMKMEFTIKAPCDGSVSRILVKEGQQLSPGDRFLELAPSAPDSSAEESGSG